MFAGSSVPAGCVHAASAATIGWLVDDVAASRGPLTGSRAAGGCECADERSHFPGTPVASACSVSMEAVLFRGDGSDESVELEGRDEFRIAKDELLWVDATSMGAEELAIVRRALGLTDRAARH